MIREKKIFFIILFFLIFSLFLFGKISVVKAALVELCEQTGYANCHDIDQSISDLFWELGTTEFHSIKVTAGYVVTLHSEVSNGGKWIQLVKDSENLENNFFTTIKSIEIEKDDVYGDDFSDGVAPVTLYNAPGGALGGGKWIQLVRDSNNLENNYIVNAWPESRIRSIEVKPGYVITLKRVYTPQGQSEKRFQMQLVKNSENLSNNNFYWVHDPLGEVTYSIRIEKDDVYGDDFSDGVAPVTLYKETGFSGKWTQIITGSADLGRENFSETASSIEIKPGYVVTLYNGIYTKRDGDYVYTGKLTKLVKSNANLDENYFDKKAKSVRIERNSEFADGVAPVTLFENWYTGQCPPSGNWLDLIAGTPKLDKFNFNNKARSMRIKAGYEVEVCDGFWGLASDRGCETHSSDDCGNCCSIFGGAQKASSIFIKKIGEDWPVILYRKEDMQMTGNNKGLFKISRDIPYLYDYNFNNRASSIKVKSGYLVTLYEDSNYTQDWTQLTIDSNKLKLQGKNNGFNDKISSIKIEKDDFFPAPVTLFQQACSYNDDWMQLAKDSFDLRDNRFNEMADGIIVRSDYEVTLWEDAGPGGDSLTISTNSHPECFEKCCSRSDLGINWKISAIELEKVFCPYTVDNPGPCDEKCPSGCTVDEDPDCGCQDGNDCCPAGCTHDNDSDCPECPYTVDNKGPCDTTCTEGCTVDEDPDCGCKNNDDCCGWTQGRQCTPAEDNDCQEVCQPDGCNDNCPPGCTGDDDPDCPGQCLDPNCPTDNDCGDCSQIPSPCCRITEAKSRELMEDLEEGIKNEINKIVECKDEEDSWQCGDGMKFDSKSDCIRGCPATDPDDPESVPCHCVKPFDVETDWGEIPEYLKLLLCCPLSKEHCLNYSGGGLCKCKDCTFWQAVWGYPGIGLEAQIVDHIYENSIIAPPECKTCFGEDVTFHPSIRMPDWTWLPDSLRGQTIDFSNAICSYLVNEGWAGWGPYYTGGRWGDIWVQLNPFVKAKTLEELITNIVNFLLLIGLPLAFLFLIIGGIMFMTAAGNPERINLAKRIIFYTVIGLVIIIFAKGLVELIKKIIG